MKGVTILIIPTQVGPTLYAYLKGRSPNNAQWLENACFAEISELAINPIVVSEQLDGEGERLIGYELISYVASLLFAEDRTRAIHITRADYYFVFDSQEYQLYLADFQTLDDLKEAYFDLFTISLVADTLEEGIERTRADIKSYFLSQ